MAAQRSILLEMEALAAELVETRSPEGEDEIGPGDLVAFPAVGKGQARFRLQVMAKHSRGDVDTGEPQKVHQGEEVQSQIRPDRPGREKRC